MKSTLFSIVVCATFSVNAESVMGNYYVVVSDVFDETVKTGTCIISGKTLDVNDQAIAGGTISNFDRSRACVSNAKGEYSMTLSIKDTALFFYHENYGEIIIWKYNFQSQHRVVINFVSMEYSDIPAVAEKPVIYLYAGQPTDIALTLKHNALTFTYPAYDDGWNVKTNQNGGIVNNADGKNYPYLFWEAEAQNLAFRNKNGLISGSLIQTRQCIEFLESSLTNLGLNATEMTDFITYWGPRLIQKEYAFVQFLVDEEVDNDIAELRVNPQPESRRRVYLLFALLDQPQVPFEFEPQQFSGFNRTGLTLLEWGGSEINLRSTLPG